MDSLSISTASSDKTLDLPESPFFIPGTNLLEAKKQLAPIRRRSGLRFEGHRGSGLLEPENTIKAFKKAIELDIDGIELDVWISKDGVPIIVHGDDNGIVTFKDASLNRHATEINSKDLNEWLLPNNEAIPTLEAVLLLCKGKMRVNIELKEETQRPVQPTLELLLRMDMMDHICFSSFFHQHKVWIEEAKRELSIEHPIEFGFLVWETKDFGEVLNQHGTSNDTLNIDIDLLLKHEEFTLAEMNKAQDRGLKIKFYFGFEQPENSEIYQRLRKLKVDTLIINHPLTCLEYIAIAAECN